MTMALGQAGMLVDVHHHFNAPGGRNGQPDWSPAKALADMDAAGVGIAVGWPGPVNAPDVSAARARARLLNEFGAGIVAAHPQRFGLFATLPPLTDVEGALAEIRFAFDELKADGVGILTQYPGAWLGDTALRPVFEELDRRRAVVFVHPQGIAGCDCATGYQAGAVSDAWLEYPFNTARAILSLMTSGALRAWPGIRFIFCHGGGAFTSLIGRIEGFRGWFEIGPERLAEVFPEGVQAEFARLHFECAQAMAPEFIAMLRSLVPDSQLLFGTDYDRFAMTHSRALFDALALPAGAREAMGWRNAARLFTRLAA